MTADGLFEQDAVAGVWTRRIDIPPPRWADRNVSALSVDSTGKLWIGYFDRGIDIADVHGEQAVTHVEDDQIFCVNRIVQDSYRNMGVVATANGIALMNAQGKILKRITEADGLISQHVTDVVVRPDGLAVATAAGVTLMNSGDRSPSMPSMVWSITTSTRWHRTTRGSWRELSEVCRLFRMGWSAPVIRLRIPC